MTNSSSRTDLSAAEKRALLAELLRKKTESSPAVFPVSHAQRAQCFLQTLAPDCVAFNLMYALRLRPLVDVTALRAAFQALIDRHPALRTTYNMDGAEPIQRVAPRQEADFVELDAASWPWERLCERMLAEAERPFDLRTGPLLRLQLFHRGPAESILLLMVHHIAVDLWSLDILMDELRQLYLAAIEGRSADLPPLSTQYADYALWQRELLAGSEGERLWAYWRAQLDGELPLLNLPLDHPRPPVQRYRGTSHAFAISPALSQGLRALAAREGVTPYTLLLAAYQVLLHRYSGQDDVLIGSPSVIRGRADLEHVVGCFVNHLVMRADFSAATSFRALLAQTRERVLDALEHQALPFNLIVERLQPPRVAGCSPIFQAVFSWDKVRRIGDEELSPFMPLGLEQTEAPRMQWGPLEVEPLAYEQLGAAYDLTLTIFDGSERLLGTLTYNSDIFEPATIERMAGHLVTLLGGIVADPDAPVAQLPLLTEDERAQLLLPREALEAYDQPLCLHERFESIAEQSPDLVALTSAGQELTYAQLNRRANQIAHTLQEGGLVPHQPVALMLETGVDQIAAMLGVLKAGGHFVCLDPNAPPARSAQILADVGPAYLVADQGCAQRHEPLLAATMQDGGCSLLVLGAEEARWLRAGVPVTVAALHNAPDQNVGLAIDPEALAYIVYTSGSTGQPKGILQSHRSFCQFLEWQSKECAILPPARVAQWASATYDASYCEIFGALCFGATLCLAPPTVRFDPAAIISWVRDEQITLLQVVPSFCRQMLRELDAIPPGVNPFPALQYMLLAGEALTDDLVRAWRARCPAPRLYNFYGPSESVLATYEPIGDLEDGRSSLPIGRAIDGRQILILDRAGQLCPTGVVGEIYIRSPYLTSGYLNRPEETARAFVQNPLHSDYRDPVYRTGDLGRFRADGRLEFFGRIDQQVKIRGMRVELGEVEAVLLRHPHVVECAVVARRFGEGDTRLAGYVVLREATPAGEILRSLREQLPAHMVPAALMVLDQLPRTRTGKIDRNALPQPELQREDLGETYIAPQTALQQEVAALWRELLQIDQVGLHDNFFELGGHSLLATQLVNRLAQHYQVSLALRDFFADPTVTGLAERIGQARQSLHAERLAALVTHVRQLSDDDVRRLLTEKRR